MIQAELSSFEVTMLLVEENYTGAKSVTEISRIPKTINFRKIMP